MKRFSLRVDAGQADAALLQMLEWFPAGVEQEDDGERGRAVRLCRRAARRGPHRRAGGGWVGHPLAGVPPAGAGRPGMGRAAVVRGRGVGGGDRSGLRVRHRRARLDPRRARASADPRAPARAGSRLRFGRALGRRAAAGVWAGVCIRPRSAGGDRERRERCPKRRGVRGRAGRRAGRPPAGRAPVGGQPPARSDRTAAGTHRSAADPGGLGLAGLAERRRRPAGRGRRLGGRGRASPDERPPHLPVLRHGGRRTASRSSRRATSTT